MDSHHPQCEDTGFKERPAGFDEDTGEAFIKAYIREHDNISQFPIDGYERCLGCCLAYLTKNRQYSEVVSDEDMLHVHFPSKVELGSRDPPILGFARISQKHGGGKGQIAIETDKALGYPAGRPCKGPQTYELYVPLAENARDLKIGSTCTARMECVAIDKAQKSDIADIKLTFADAMLVEIYKELRGVSSFQGCCVIPRAAAQVGEGQVNAQVGGEGQRDAEVREAAERINDLAINK